MTRGITKRQRNREARTNRAIVRNAYANPNTRCVACGNTLDQCGPRGDGRNRNRTPITWHAGHPDGRWPGNQRRPECSHCNTSRGATHGNKTRRGTPTHTPTIADRDPHTEIW